MIIIQADLLKELHAHANTFLKENFGMGLGIPIKINGRLRSNGGRFRYQTNNLTNSSTSLDIEIAKFICENATKEEIFDILEHECVHYALLERSEPCGDKDRHFINTCKRLDVCLNHKIVKQRYIYNCPECGAEIIHDREIPKGYCLKCGHCKGKIRPRNLATIKSMKVRQVI